MKKNKLRKVIVLGLSTALVSMSCLNASAMDYKKILNKKNISIAAVGSAFVSAAIVGSYFLYNHFKAPSAEKSQNREKFEVFSTSYINEQGKKKNKNTKPMLLEGVQEISEGEKCNIVKRKGNIKSIRVSKKGREKGNPLLIFSNGREIEGNDLNLDKNFRQDRNSKMLYFKLDGKLYELGESMFEKSEDTTLEDTCFFACVDKKIWDDNAIFGMQFGYMNGETSKMYKEDSWRALLFAAYIYEA